MLKKVIILLAVLLVCGGGAYYYYKKKAAAEVKPPDPTARAERGNIVDSVLSDGKVVSNLDVEIKCKASGEIIKLPFDISDWVRKGQLLVALDPTDEERTVRQREAGLQASLAKVESAKVNLALQEANLETQKSRAEADINTAKRRAEDFKAKAERTHELLSAKLASREEAETADTALVAAQSDFAAANIRIKELEATAQALDLHRQEIKMAEAQADIDKIQLEVARQRHSDTTVNAPMDGIVTSRKVQVGQIISSPISNVAGGTTILTLSDLSQIFVLASVDESDIGKVRLGQKVSIKVDAFPARRFDGSVVQMSPLGVNNSNVVTFQVKIEVTSPEKRVLLPEMTASVEIIAATSENTLLVPTDAVYRKGGSFKTMVLGAGGAKAERDVKVGITNGQKVEVTSGLEEGTEVIVKKAEGDSKFRGPGGSPMLFGRPR